LFRSSCLDHITDTLVILNLFSMLSLLHIVMAVSFHALLLNDNSVHEELNDAHDDNQYYQLTIVETLVIGNKNYLLQQPLRNSTLIPLQNRNLQKYVEYKITKSLAWPPHIVTHHEQVKTLAILGK